MDISRFEASWEARSGHWLDLLKALVNQNSFADHVAGVDAVRALLVPEFEALGFSVEEPLLPPCDSPRVRAAHLVARKPAPGAPKVLLIAHLDTVFPEGDAFRSFLREGDLLLGPGVGDIRAGIVTILGAAAALSDAGCAGAVDLTVVMNSDEEVGSHSSRDLIRTLAQECSVALGFEPAFHPPGESVLAPSRIQHVVERKGCGRQAFRLKGVASHSGGAHQFGVSAIEGLARKIVDLHALTDSKRGVTTNVGIIGGGRSVNTVAPEAWAEVDFRYKTAADGRLTDQRIREILERPERVNPASASAVTCEIELGGGALWPPLVPTKASEAVSRLVVAATREYGLEAEPISRGGASDAAHAAAAGIPAICGLGPVTSGIHTDAERTSVPALRNAVLVAALTLTKIESLETT